MDRTSRQGERPDGVRRVDHHRHSVARDQDRGRLRGFRRRQRARRHADLGRAGERRLDARRRSSSLHLDRRSGRAGAIGVGPLLRERLDRGGSRQRQPPPRGARAGRGRREHDEARRQRGCDRHRPRSSACHLVRARRNCTTGAGRAPRHAWALIWVWRTPCARRSPAEVARAIVARSREAPRPRRAGRAGSFLALLASSPWRPHSEDSRRSIERLVGSDVHDGEWHLVLLFFANLFLLLTAYYILKVIREPLILLGGGAVSRSYARGMQAGLLFLVIPAYSALANRVEPARLVKWIFGVFVALPGGVLRARERGRVGRVRVLRLAGDLQHAVDRAVLVAGQRHHDGVGGEAAVPDHRGGRNHRGDPGRADRRPRHRVAPSLSADAAGGRPARGLHAAHAQEPRRRARAPGARARRTDPGARRARRIHAGARRSLPAADRAVGPVPQLRQHDRGLHPRRDGECQGPDGRGRRRAATSSARSTETSRPGSAR